MDKSLEELGLVPDLTILPAEVRDLLRRGYGGEYPSCFEAAMVVCVELIRAGYGAAEIWMIMTDPRNGISKIFFAKSGGPAEVWLERIICAAPETVAQSEPDAHYSRFAAEDVSEVEKSGLARYGQGTDPPKPRPTYQSVVEARKVGDDLTSQ